MYHYIVIFRGWFYNGSRVLSDNNVLQCHCCLDILLPLLVHDQQTAMDGLHE